MTISMGPGANAFSELASRRQQQAFRERVTRWVIHATEPAAQAAETLSQRAYESADGDGYRFVVDEPSGERFFVHIRANGSIQCELGLPWETDLPDVDRQFVSSQMADVISTLYHDDVLKFSHALYAENGGFLLRSISSIDSTPSLMTIVAEALMLTDLLMDLVLDRLMQTSPAYSAPDGQGTGSDAADGLLDTSEPGPGPFDMFGRRNMPMPSGGR